MQYLCDVCRRETVEAETVHQHVRYRSLPLGLAPDVAIQLSVDDDQLLARQAPGVLVRFTQRLVIEQEPAPDVRADRRVTLRDHSAVPHDLLQHGAQGALAGRRGPFQADEQGPFCGRNGRISLFLNGLGNPWGQRPSDDRAAIAVADMIADQVGEEIRVRSQVTAVACYGSQNAIKALIDRIAQGVLSGQSLFPKLQDRSPFPLLNGLTAFMGRSLFLAPGEEKESLVRWLRRGGGEQGLDQLLPDSVAYRDAQFLINAHDLAHPRLDVAGEDVPGDPAETSSELDLVVTFRHQDIGRDSDDQFVQHQPLWLENHELLRTQAGLLGNLIDVLLSRGHIFRTIDSLQLPVRRRDVRLQAGIPCGEFCLSSGYSTAVPCEDFGSWAAENGLLLTSSLEKYVIYWNY